MWPQAFVMNQQPFCPILVVRPKYYGKPHCIPPIRKAFVQTLSVVLCIATEDLFRSSGNLIVLRLFVATQMLGT